MYMAYDYISKISHVFAIQLKYTSIAFRLDQADGVFMQNNCRCFVEFDKLINIREKHNLFWASLTDIKDLFLENPNFHIMYTKEIEL